MKKAGKHVCEIYREGKWNLRNERWGHHIETWEGEAAVKRKSEGVGQ